MMFGFSLTNSEKTTDSFKEGFVLIRFILFFRDQSGCWMEDYRDIREKN
jgi:hypothetical protein